MDEPEKPLKSEYFSAEKSISNAPNFVSIKSSPLLLLLSFSLHWLPSSRLIEDEEVEKVDHRHSASSPAAFLSSQETRISLVHYVNWVSFRSFSLSFSPASFSSPPTCKDGVCEQALQSEIVEGLSDLDIIAAKACKGSDEGEVLQSLSSEEACNSINLSNDLVEKLLHRFKDDWKSALGVFKWADHRSGYKPFPEAYDQVVNTLGKTKQMKKMMNFLEEMNQIHLVSPKTIAIVMRRYAGAGEWENAVRIFDDLETYGLEKNTESMNLLLDTLCKEKKVDQAREVFLKLKTHISPDAFTFNIFIHGWCKANRVDEAYWTMQEMKGYGYRPCVISYSTIILFYCRQFNFSKVYELLDEMEANKCPPNVISYTTIMCSLAKSKEFEEALQISERMNAVGCEPDTLFYNSLIHTLGQAGQIRKATQVFESEMPRKGVKPNTSTYNTLIAIFCHSNQAQKAMNLLREMEDLNLCKPDLQTFYPLLKSCFKTKWVDGDLSKLLDCMINKHHLSLDICTYTLLIHGLCRAGKCEWAYHFFQEMCRQDIKPRYLTCRLLLDELKQKNMNQAAESLEVFMKRL